MGTFVQPLFPQKLYRSRFSTQGRIFPMEKLQKKFQLIAEIIELSNEGMLRRLLNLEDSDTISLKHKKTLKD